MRTSLPVLVLRTAVIAPLFLLAIVSCALLQYFAILVVGKNYRSWPFIMKSKTYFVVFMTFFSLIISPCTISLSSDPDLIPKDAFRVDLGGNLHLQLSPNAVYIGNHQIYTDWLFLWWITYTARMSDSVYIVLKDLSKIPVLGYGMKNFGFLFLSRKWEKDKVVLTNQLLEIDANARGAGPANGEQPVASTSAREGDTPESSNMFYWPRSRPGAKLFPFQLVLYPEGTVISPHTRERLAKFCTQRGMPVLKHVLLPRVRGLFLALRKLRNTAEVVYDFTCGYHGLRPDEYGEDVFTLKRFYLRGMGPKKVSFYVRAWKLADIPLGVETEDIDDVLPDDLARFEAWLFDMWYSKDKLMAHFHEHGSFPKAPTVEAQFKIRSILEVPPLYVSVAAVLAVFCGAVYWLVVVARSLLA